MPVPNQFANVTTSIPLSQLDANFNTPITLGNTAIQLGNTVTTLNNMTLANVTVTSGSINVTSGNITVTNASVTTANVTTANITTAIIATANVATANVTTSQILNYGTANQVQYLDANKALTGSANMTFNGTTLTVNDLTDSSLTSNRVVYAGTGGNFQSSANLTFDGTTLTAANNINVPNTFGFKNRIINGAMVIDQRNAGASITPTNLQYSVDRWKCYLTQSSKYSVQQNAGSVTPPTGFTNYLGAVSLSAYSVVATDTFLLSQLIEGYNVFDFGFGAAGASSVTLSFWVRSSLTGTFGGAFSNSDFSRNYPFTYTISAANTWEQKTITIVGDTSGAWQKTNATGLIVSFNLGTGSTYSGPAGAWSSSLYYSATGAVSVVGTNGATFYITGVQLEKGSTATSFDYRPYGTELALCQRYFETLFGQPFGSGFFDSNTQAKYFIPFTLKRAAPTVTTNTVSNFAIYWTGATAASTNIAVDVVNVNGARISVDGPNGTDGQGTLFIDFNGNARIFVSAEL